MAQSGPVEQLVVQTFAELGATDPSAVIRTILLRDRHFVGYRFRGDGVQAVWLASGEVVAFFDGRGKLLKAVRAESPEKQEAA